MSRLLRFNLLFVLSIGLELQSATVQPGNISFSNFQSSLDSFIVPGYGVLGGFNFSTFYTDAFNHLFLPLGYGGQLTSNPTEQFINAQASVDFSFTGYKIIRIEKLGTMQWDGSSVHESFTVNITETSILANMYLHSDVMTGRTDTGMIKYPQVMLTLEETAQPKTTHNPEPSAFILSVGGIALILVCKRIQRIKK